MPRPRPRSRGRAGISAGRQCLEPETPPGEWSVRVRLSASCYYCLIIPTTSAADPPLRRRRGRHSISIPSADAPERSCDFPDTSLRPRRAPTAADPEIIRVEVVEIYPTRHIYSRSTVLRVTACTNAQLKQGVHPLTPGSAFVDTTPCLDPLSFVPLPVGCPVVTSRGRRGLELFHLTRANEKLPRRVLRKVHVCI